MPWAYYCESCKQLRGFMYKFRPKQCGLCGSKKIDIGKPDDPRLQQRRFGDGPRQAAYAVSFTTPLPDGTRVAHNIGKGTPVVKRANGSYVPLPPGEALLLDPDDVIVQGNGPTPFAI